MIVCIVGCFNLFDNNLYRLIDDGMSPFVIYGDFLHIFWCMIREKLNYIFQSIFA